MIYVFFFFQAEDGIRDVAVTGVQTCALPISGSRSMRPRNARALSRTSDQTWSWLTTSTSCMRDTGLKKCRPTRSEERRVGKSVDLGGRRIIKKKKKKKL